MPPERVLRFLLYHTASFRGLSPAPSHHLGVDVFVGTFGSPHVVATSGLSQPIGPPLAMCGPSLSEAGEVGRPSAGGLSPRLVADGSDATQGDAARRR